MRPLGVSLIGGFELFISGLLLLLAIAAILGMGVLGAILGSTSGMGGPAMPFLAGAGMIAGFIVLFPSALFGLVGWNLLRMREWARIVTVVLAVLGTAGAALGLLWALSQLRLFFMMTTMVRLSINLAILWHLNQAHIKQRFDRQGAAPALSP
jgi:hypothetical protein